MRVRTLPVATRVDVLRFFTMHEMTGMALTAIARHTCTLTPFIQGSTRASGIKLGTHRAITSSEATTLSCHPPGLPNQLRTPPAP